MTEDTMSTDISRLAARLDRLESQDAVRRLKATYMHWCDERRGAEIADLFWPDATWEALGGALGGTVTGHAAIGAMFATSRLTFTVHYLTNESIEVEGDRAVGRWKLFEPCTFRDELAIWQGGHYVDDFERRGGEWRISHLRLALDFKTPFDEGWLRTRHVELPK
jgi:hypothetical protein